MQKTLTTIVCCFILSYSYGQRKIAGYLQAQYTRTIYDETLANNPSALGFGLQVYFNNSSKLKPTLDLTADAFLEDDKVFRLDENGNSFEDLVGMLNLFGGVSYHPSGKIYLSFVAGPSFNSGHILLGIKPSFGFYFSPKQKWTGKIAYMNIFNRTKSSNQDLGAISFSIGIRIF